jgi:hypothetical protein
MTISKEQRLSGRNKSNLNKEQRCKIMGNKKCRNVGTRHDYEINKGYREGTNRTLIRNNVVKLWGTNIRS